MEISHVHTQTAFDFNFYLSQKQLLHSFLQIRLYPEGRAGGGGVLLLTLCSGHHMLLNAMYLLDCTSGAMPYPLLWLMVNVSSEVKDTGKPEEFFLVLPMTSDSQETAKMCQRFKVHAYHTACNDGLVATSTFPSGLLGYDSHHTSLTHLGCSVFENYFKRYLNRSWHISTLLSGKVHHNLYSRY